MPLSTSSKTSVGTGSAAASTTLSASRKRDSSPPEAILPSGPGALPGIGRDLEGDALGALLAPVALRQRLEAGGEARLARASAAAARPSTAASSRLRRLARAPRSALRRPRRRPGAPRPRPASRLAERRRLVVERAPAGPSKRSAQGGQRVDRDVVLAGEIAQREQPLLDLLQPRGVGSRSRGQAAAARVDRLGQLGGGAVERGERRVAASSPALSAMRSRRRCAP